MLEAEHGVSAAVSTMRYWRGRESINQHIASMARLQLSDALDTYDAMIDSMGPAVITIDGDDVATTGDGPITEVAKEGNSIPDSPIASGEAITDGAIESVGDIRDGAITSGVPTDRAAGAMDHSLDAIGGMTDSANGSIAGGALAPGAAIDATISIEPPLAASTDSIKRSPKRARSFYGPNIDPGEAFTSSAEGPAPMAPLPNVKLADYEEFLQGYLNDHPSFGYKKLLTALERDMHVTCTRHAMETWFSHHKPVVLEPTIADHEDFLLEQLVKTPSIGYKLMMKAIHKARGVTFKEAPIRAWLAAHKGALPMPTAAAASSSAAPSMALLKLADMEQYAPFLRQQLVDSPLYCVKS